MQVLTHTGKSSSQKTKFKNALRTGIQYSDIVMAMNDPQMMEAIRITAITTMLKLRKARSSFSCSSLNLAITRFSASL